ncbi:Uncharacterised protein [Vibrio cholerae]|nr:Uncharacterised protein [Vibrio cholerae]CSD67232.1 Uncharacterised protein [Vibrio cholerae]
MRRRSWCCRCCTFRFKDHDQRASRHFVTCHYFDLFNDTRLRRRNFHRSFVAFNRDQRLLFSHFVADFDENLSDFNLIRTDVRYINFDCHYFSYLQLSVQRVGFFSIDVEFLDCCCNHRLLNFTTFCQFIQRCNYHVASIHFKVTT